MSIPLSQLIPSSRPLHPVHMSIPHVYISIPTLQRGTVFLDSTHMCEYTIFVFLTYSLCMTDSRSIFVSKNDPISFLFMAE